MVFMIRTQVCCMHFSAFASIAMNICEHEEHHLSFRVLAPRIISNTLKDDDFCFWNRWWYLRLWTTSFNGRLLRVRCQRSAFCVVAFNEILLEPLWRIEQYAYSTLLVIRIDERQIKSIIYNHTYIVLYSSPSPFNHLVTESIPHIYIFFEDHTIYEVIVLHIAAMSFSLEEHVRLCAICICQQPVIFTSFVRTIESNASSSFHPQSSSSTFVEHHRSTTPSRCSGRVLCCQMLTLDTRWRQWVSAMLTWDDDEDRNSFSECHFLWATCVRRLLVALKWSETINVSSKQQTAAIDSRGLWHWRTEWGEALVCMASGRSPTRKWKL